MYVDHTVRRTVTEVEISPKIMVGDVKNWHSIIHRAAAV